MKRQRRFFFRRHTFCGGRVWRGGVGTWQWVPTSTYLLVHVFMNRIGSAPPRPLAHFCWEPQVCIKSSCNFHTIIGKCIKTNVVSVHFSVTTLFKYKTTFEVTDPPARAFHHVMAMDGTVPHFIDLGNREMKSDWFKFRLRTFLEIEWMTHRLYKIEITLSIQAISEEVHGCAARRVKTYGIPVKLRILPPDVRSENEPFRPGTSLLVCIIIRIGNDLLLGKFGNQYSCGFIVLLDNICKLMWRNVIQSRW